MTLLSDSSGCEWRPLEQQRPQVKRGRTRLGCESLREGIDPVNYTVDLDSAPLRTGRLTVRILHPSGSLKGFRLEFAGSADFCQTKFERSGRKLRTCHWRRKATMSTSVDEFIPTRRSLLSRLKDCDDQESWREFFNTYWRLIYGVALKAGLDDAEAQDVVQDTVIAIAGKMHGFKYDPEVGSFKNWLLVITRRRIADHQRKQCREPFLAERSASPTTETAAMERIPAPVETNIDAIWDKQWEKNLLDAAIDQVRHKVDPRQFQIFDCYVLKEWPVKDVTRTLGVSASQVYLARHRISRLIKTEARRLEKRMSSGMGRPST